MEKNSTFNNRGGARIFGGLLLIAVGTAFLLRNTGYNLPAWLFSWPMILILVGIYSAVKHRFRHFSWLILIGVGGFFLADKINPNLDIRFDFWPLLIIGLGLLFIFKPRKKKCFGRRERWQREQVPVSTVIVDTAEKENSGSEISDYLLIDSVFSGIDRAILSKNFRGGKISCVFGGAQVNMLQADISGTVVLKIDIVFGGAKMIVPANWTVINEVDGVFHNIEDDRKNSSSGATDPNKQLVLKGSCIFGGVEIKSY